MNKLELQKLIDLGLSTHQIAKQMNGSQTNIRYWLRKYGLNTKTSNIRKAVKECSNLFFCICCGEALSGCKTKFCSTACKQKNFCTKQANTNEYQQQRAKTRKLELITKSGGGCSKCGYNKNFAALQFHHRDPNNKLFALDSRKLSNTNWESILIEWSKCDLLCANCHSEEHNPDKFINLVGAAGFEPATVQDGFDQL